MPLEMFTDRTSRSGRQAPGNQRQCRPMKSSTRELKISGCSQCTECPASATTAVSLSGI